MSSDQEIHSSDPYAQLVSALRKELGVKHSEVMAERRERYLWQATGWGLVVALAAVGFALPQWGLLAWAPACGAMVVLLALEATARLRSPRLRVSQNEGQQSSASRRPVHLG